MPRWNPLHAICRHLWAIGLALASGCAHSQTDLQDRLARRVTPVEIATGNSTSRAEAKVADRPTTDAKVHPAVASQPSQARQSSSEDGRSPSLPAAIEGLPARVESGRPTPAAPLLPPDSDEAALEAITASGKPLTLPEAIEAAFRFQPRLRSQLENISQARGLQQIAFSAFLPVVAGSYDVGGFSLGAGGLPVQVGKPLRFNFIPSLGTVPIGLNLGTTFELAELRIQWLLLDFGRRLGLHEQARLATDIAGLQTERAYQTVANEVATAYYNVLRTEALRRTTQDALRRAEDQLSDARKLEREGVVEREIVLRSEVQRAEARQQLHAATEAQFVALAALSLAMGLKSRPARSELSSRRRFPHWSRICAIACRRPRGSDANSMSCAAQWTSLWKEDVLLEPTSRPKSSRMGHCSTSSSKS